MPRQRTPDSAVRLTGACPVCSSLSQINGLCLSPTAGKQSAGVGGSASPRGREVPRSRSQGTGRRVLVKAHSVMEEPTSPPPALLGCYTGSATAAAAAAAAGPHLRVWRARQCKSFGTVSLAPRPPLAGCAVPS